LKELKDDADGGAAPGRERPFRHVGNRKAADGNLTERRSINAADQVQQR